MSHEAFEFDYPETMDLKALAPDRDLLFPLSFGDEIIISFARCLTLLTTNIKEQHKKFDKVICHKF